MGILHMRPLTVLKKKNYIFWHAEYLLEAGSEDASQLRLSPGQILALFVICFPRKCAVISFNQHALA